MMRPLLRGIFFDLDDTLIGYACAEQAALAASCEQAVRLIPGLDAREFAHSVLKAYRTRYEYGQPGYADLATLPLKDFRHNLTFDALKLAGASDVASKNDSLIPTLLEVYADAEQAALKTLPDVRETLALLRPHFHLGVITNGPSALQRAKLAALALSDSFDEIIVDTEFGSPKPDCRIFEYAAQRAKLNADELLFVGNSLEADVAGAREAGWTAVWLDETGLPPALHEPQPHFVIACVADVARLPLVATRLAERN